MVMGGNVERRMEEGVRGRAFSVFLKPRVVEVKASGRSLMLPEPLHAVVGEWMEQVEDRQMQAAEFLWQLREFSGELFPAVVRCVLELVKSPVFKAELMGLMQEQCFSEEMPGQGASLPVCDAELPKYDEKIDSMREDLSKLAERYCQDRLSPRMFLLMALALLGKKEAPGIMRYLTQIVVPEKRDELQDYARSMLDRAERRGKQPKDTSLDKPSKKAKEAEQIFFKHKAIKAAVIKEEPSFEEIIPAYNAEKKTAFEEEPLVESIVPETKAKTTEIIYPENPLKLICSADPVPSIPARITLEKQEQDTEKAPASKRLISFTPEELRKKERLESLYSANAWNWYYHHRSIVLLLDTVDEVLTHVPRGKYYVGSNASFARIRKTYLALLREIHPDRHLTSDLDTQAQVAAVFPVLNAAYQRRRNIEQQREYQESGRDRR